MFSTFLANWDLTELTVATFFFFILVLLAWFHSCGDSAHRELAFEPAFDYGPAGPWGLEAQPYKMSPFLVDL